MELAWISHSWTYFTDCSRRPDELTPQNQIFQQSYDKLIWFLDFHLLCITDPKNSGEDCWQQTFSETSKPSFHTLIPDKYAALIKGELCVSRTTNYVLFIPRLWVLPSQILMLNLGLLLVQISFLGNVSISTHLELWGLQVTSMLIYHINDQASTNNLQHCAWLGASSILSMMCVSLLIGGNQSSKNVLSTISNLIQVFFIIKDCVAQTWAQTKVLSTISTKSIASKSNLNILIY